MQPGAGPRNETTWRNPECALRASGEEDRAGPARGGSCAREGGHGHGGLGVAALEGRPPRRGWLEWVSAAMGTGARIRRWCPPRMGQRPILGGHAALVRRRVFKSLLWRPCPPALGGTDPSGAGRLWGGGRAHVPVHTRPDFPVGTLVHCLPDLGQIRGTKSGDLWFGVWKINSAFLALDTGRFARGTSSLLELSCPRRPFPSDNFAHLPNDRSGLDSTSRLLSALTVKHRSGYGRGNWEVELGGERAQLKWRCGSGQAAVFFCRRFNDYWKGFKFTAELILIKGV